MRMRLHKSTRIGDYEIYPIYDIDFSGIVAETGYTQEYSNDVVGTNAYKYRQWKSINNNLLNYVPLSIMPKIETADGNIIPFWHRYTNIVDGRYTLDNDNLSSYAAIEQGVRPDDWGTNPNYIDLERTSASSHNIIRPSISKLTSSWSSSTSYYEDTKRTILRMFYTDTGNSFTVGKHTVSTGNNYYYARAYSVGTYPHPNSTTRTGTHYSYTDTNNNMLNTNYYIQDGLAVNPASTSEYQAWSTYPDGYNCPMFFVHFTDSGTDFYGVAIVQMSDFTENSYPVAIHVSAWDTTFWGTSIISGGESGAGEWGNNSIPTINDGTFSSTSNSVGPDNPNYSTTAIQTRVNSALSGLFSGLTGVYSIYLLDTADGQSISFTELTRIYNVLYASGNDKFLTRYLQSMYNPLSAVIAMHLIPYQFTASALFGVTVKKQLTISGYNVSNAISETTPPEYNILKPLGRVVFPSLDMPQYFGGFADFAPYTQCILHLPFIGAIELKTNAIAHGSITVEYLCDMISGNVTARISCTDNTGENTQYVHTASGNCAYNLPLFTMNQNGDAVGKLLSGGAGIVSGALTGTPVNVATGIAGVVGSAIESSFSPRSTQISGNMGGNNMLMSNLDIWVEIIRPVWVENMYYQKLNGIPADMSNCIADCGQDANAGIPYDGFVQIEKIDLDNVPCTEQEKQEIETLLKQGVFIRGSEI